MHMAQLMPLPLTVSCFTKIQTGFTFQVSADPGSPGKRAVKRVCVYLTGGGLVQVDELISSAEREFSSADLPLEPTRAEMMLREHEASRSKVKHLLDCTAGEGDEIVVRVRQQVDCSGAALSLIHI